MLACHRNTLSKRKPDGIMEFIEDLSTHRKSDQERAKILASPGFGDFFTDHTAVIDWSADGEGPEGTWSNARIEPYGPIAMDPAASVLHYGQEIFEGLKAYRHNDGSVWTFRPHANAARLNRSAERLALPQLDEEAFVESLRRLVKVDVQWVPSGNGEALYLRPFMIATEAFLGVRAARKVSYRVIASPAGNYFGGELKPVGIWVSHNYARAGRGGTGAAKCGGNYAASLLPQMQAYDNGCAQVLFLDGETSSRIDELGGMNVFFVYGTDTLVTPRLTGSILEGVTRDSILQLARDRGLTVQERDVTLGEWQDGVASGAITEVFACGTAAVVTPISQLKGPNLSIGDPDAPAGEITMALRQELTDIQYGRLPDRHGWLTRLDTPAAQA